MCLVLTNLLLLSENGIIIIIQQSLTWIIVKIFRSCVPCSVPSLPRPPAPGVATLTDKRQHRTRIMVGTGTNITDRAWVTNHRLRSELQTWQALLDIAGILRRYCMIIWRSWVLWVCSSCWMYCEALKVNVQTCEIFIFQATRWQSNLLKTSFSINHTTYVVADVKK